MANYRRGRINDALAQELSIALRQVRDPGVANNFVSITRAEVAADLKIAKVYFSVLGDWDAAEDSLKRCTGMLRHHLAETLNLRITPDLLFRRDASMEHGAKISRILKEIGSESSSDEE